MSLLSQLEREEAEWREEILRRLKHHGLSLSDFGGDYQAASDHMDAMPGERWPDERV